MYNQTAKLYTVRVLMAATVLCVAVILFGILFPFLLYALFAIGGITLFLLIYIPLFFKSYSFLCQDDALIISEGVIFKTTRIIARKKIIFAESYTTPLSRSFGLKGIIVKSARKAVFVPEILELDAVLQLGEML